MLTHRQHSRHHNKYIYKKSQSIAPKNRPVLLACLLFLALLSTVAGILAYLADAEEIQNTLAIGNVDVTLADITPASNGTELVPGEAVPKTLVVQNTGVNSCFVKADITVTNTAVLPWLRLLGTGNKWTQPVFINGIATIYYTDILPAGEGDPPATTPMFTHIKLLDTLDGAPLLEGMFLFEDGGEPVIGIEEFEVLVKITAIQTRYNGTNAADAQTAFEAFEEVHPPPTQP